eukprot:SAG31_NODE_19665_length_595_cov_0.856855_2_plen_63_part_00
MPGSASVTPRMVYAAAARLDASNLIHRTPLLESLALNNRAGARILVKAENLQVWCANLAAAS